MSCLYLKRTVFNKYVVSGMSLIATGSDQYMTSLESSASLHLPRAAIRMSVQMDEERGKNTDSVTTTFSPQVIEFALFGTISRLSFVPGKLQLYSTCVYQYYIMQYYIMYLSTCLISNVFLETTVFISDKITKVTQQFPDIPEIFIFGPSTVQFHSVGVFCRQPLNQGTACSHN